MTSIPSPFDALRSLLPLPGRGGPDGSPFGPLGDVPDLDDGPSRGPGQHARHSDGPGGPLRADGQTPLSPAEAHQVADVLTDAMRQNPSHPLFRDLPQASPEVFRQWVVDVLTSPQSMMHALPREAVASLAQATSSAAALLHEPGPSPAMAQARAEGDAMRASIQSQAQAQQATAERAQGMPRADEVRMANAMAQATGDARTATDPRVASALAQAQAQGQAPGLAQAPRAEAALPPGTLPLQAAPAHQASQASGATGAQAPAAPLPADASRPILDTPAQLLQARGPEGAAPARAERADALPQVGLPGLVGAAGITLAAVAQPAGTTFAHAPQEAIRARTPAERRAIGEDVAREQAARDADARNGNGAGTRGEQRDGGDDDASAELPTRTTRGIAAGGEAPGAAAAAGHTLLAGTRQPAYDGEGEDDARPAGHAAAGDETPADSNATADLRQWIYWSLIAVTYGCLASALATMTPWAASLPIATDALPAWRNGLTIAGFASGIWAWVLARRMR